MLNHFYPDGGPGRVVRPRPRITRALDNESLSLSRMDADDEPSFSPVPSPSMALLSTSPAASGHKRRCDSEAGGSSSPTKMPAALKNEADTSIDVPIWTCGSREVATVRTARDSTIQHVKKDLLTRFMVEEDQQILVFCGKVMDGDTALVDLVAGLQQGEKMWIVIRNVWRVPMMQSEHLMVMQSVFAFSGPGKAAGAGPCCKTFQEFCQSHGFMCQEKVEVVKESRYSAAEMTWRPDEADQKRLAASVHALKNSFGANCTDFPQVEWFPDYGCALLVSNIDVARLSLQVHFRFHALPLLPLQNTVSADCTALAPLCADYWTRRMGLHVSPSKSSAHVQFDTANIGRQNTACRRHRPI